MTFSLLNVIKVADWAAVIQAITGIAACILSIITLTQSKKIKELSDITNALAAQTLELSKQTEQLGSQAKTLSDSYKLEVATRITERIPVFVKRSMQATSFRRIRINLTNIGSTSDFFGIDCPDVEIFETFEYYDKTINEERKIISIDFWCKPHFEAAHFSFNLYFHDKLHQYYKQVVSVNPGEVDFTIGPPIVIEKIENEIITPSNENPYFFAF